MRKLASGNKDIIFRNKPSYDVCWRLH